MVGRVPVCPHVETEQAPGTILHTLPCVLHAPKLVHVQLEHVLVCVPAQAPEPHDWLSDVLDGLHVAAVQA